MEVIKNQRHIDTIKRFIKVKQSKEQVNTILLCESVQRMFTPYSTCANVEALERDIARILFSE